MGKNGRQQTAAVGTPVKSTGLAPLEGISLWTKDVSVHWTGRHDSIRCEGIRQAHELRRVSDLDGQLLAEGLKRGLDPIDSVA